MYQLNEVLELAKKADVGFACFYSECDSSWYFSVQSNAPSLEWQGRSRSFEVARENVKDYLKGLISRG